MPLQRFHFSTCACVVDAEYPEKRAVKVHSSCEEHASEDPQAAFDAAWELNQRFSADAMAFLETVPAEEKTADGAPLFELDVKRVGDSFVVSKAKPTEEGADAEEAPVKAADAKP